MKNPIRHSNDPIEGIVRTPRNASELELYRLMTNGGFDVVRRGWPDFACFRDDELCLVEVKPDRDTHLKRSQYRLMKALVDRGIKCYRWSPDVGFQSIY